MAEDDLAQAWASALTSEQAGPGVEVGLDLRAADNLDMLLDVPVTVSVEIGRTSLSIKEVLDLAPGSIVSLSKLAGEPMDLLVNGKRIAQGEIVIVDESFGIRDSFGIRVTNILATPTP